MRNILRWIGVGAFVLLGCSLLLFLFAGLFVYVPAEMAADAKCLERGYPHSRVTWNLKRYCSNLDGSVTVKVDELK